MSAQFGRWNLDERLVDSEYLERVGASLSPYGPDGGSSFSDGNVAILHYAFHTTKESHEEKQPYICPSGVVITWDGRLDNRADLIRELRDSVAANSTDVSLVAAAYERWGTSCFGKLIGDWALSIWNARDRSLVLAKDPIGARHLYYSFDDNQVTWSTILDPIVRLADKTFELNEEYIAGWLSMFPAVHLTPCVGVHSVPPSSYVLLRREKLTVTKYWDFNPKNKIRYHDDAEYEDHFRTVFSTAIRRRLRSDRAVLAELSGGRDSSSIVCMADEIIARGLADTPRLDTLSYFNDSEPNWNERPYFTKVEEKRGYTGWHVNAAARDPKRPSASESSPEFSCARFVPTPGYDGRTSEQVRMCLASRGNRVVLSGVGGDETMGGVPAPSPELQDLLAKAQFHVLANQLKIWALKKREPWFHLLWEASLSFFSYGPRRMSPAPWLQPKFVERHWRPLAGYPYRTKLVGPLPTFQENLGTLNALRRQLTCIPPPFGPPYEKCYPYLDRDLLEFVFAIPREQLMRPTQRRSLMRRALVGIVPDEILNRRAKAFVIRSSMVAISNDQARFTEMTQNMLADSLGIVNSERVSEVLQKVRRGEGVPMVTLKRTLLLENWLRDLRALDIVDLNTTLHPRRRSRASIEG